MRTRPFIVRCVAIVMILVFSQKAGAGLFLHNLFHNSNETSTTSGQSGETGAGLNYSCTCVDDLLMPFTGTEEPVYSAPVLIFTEPVTFFKQHIPLYTPVLLYLRGPPACTA